MKWPSLFIRAIVVAVLCLSATSNAVAQGTQIQGPRDAADVYSGVVYGPIDRSDTLWAISSQYRKNQQFTVYQVMLAIYELNPRGFVNRNFNTMVNGTTLQLPTDRYIARIDPQRAKIKAEEDDRVFTQSTGRQGQSANETSDGQAQSANLKPDVPLVNKEELDATQKQFQQQINSLKRQQTNIVNDLKKQLGESIQATQNIVDENKLVLEELAKKDAEFIALKTELSEDFQSKLDDQAAQIQELREFFALAKMKEQAQENDSFGNLIRKPIFIIIAATVAFFLIFVLIAMLLLRKPTNVNAKVEDGAQDLDSDSIDEKASNDADDLLAILESGDISDDDLLDDILSDDLEDSIDEVALNTDDFGEIDDEMLVPNQRQKTSDDEISDALADLGNPDLSVDDDMLEAELNSIDLDDEKIGLDGDDNSSDQLDDFDGLDAEPEEVDIDSILDEESVDISQVEADAIKQLSEGDEFSEEDGSFAENLAESDLLPAQDDDEQSEIDIDDLLEQNALDGDTPEGFSFNVSGEIDEKVIGQIEAEIAEKNIELNTLTESFYEELTSNDSVDDDSDLEIDIDDDIDSSSKTPVSPDQQKSIRPLDDITKGVEDDIADAIANVKDDDTFDALDSDGLDSPLTDELLTELGAELPGDVDSDIEDLLSQPITDEIDDLDIDSVLESSLNELHTGTIDFEQHEELTDDLKDALLDKDVLPVDESSDVELAEDDNEEPESIDIDSVLDDSLNDLINNQLDDDDLDLADDDSNIDSSVIESATESEPTSESKLELSSESEPDPAIESKRDPEANLDPDFILDEHLEPEINLDSNSDTTIEKLYEYKNSRDNTFQMLDAELENKEDQHQESYDISDEMLNELDSTEALDEIKLDDIDLGTQDLAVIESDALEAAKENNLALDDIPSFSSEERQANRGSASEGNAKEHLSDVEDDTDSKHSYVSIESDEDLLDLPGLDEWLDEDDTELVQALDKFNKTDSEDDVLREIEEADFDSLLAEMGSLSDEQTAAEIDKLSDGADDGVFEDRLKEQDTQTLDNPDLDLTALFDESVIDNSKDFIDVDSLLQESENVTPATDDELALDLDMSLDKFLNDGAEIDVDIDADQASNLDLARVYIDMEDNEAAIEALDEVVKKGNDEQKEEAKALLEQLKG
nr:FimV/HubP family polar landmark protein [uncultured Glaciecola sp.]